MRACDAAEQVLRETNNPAVMYGDIRLLHAIAERAGLRSAGKMSKTERCVLNALSRQPGVLLKYRTRAANGKSVRIFRLPTRKDHDHA